MMADLLVSALPNIIAAYLIGLAFAPLFFAAERKERTP